MLILPLGRCSLKVAPLSIFGVGVLTANYWKRRTHRRAEQPKIAPVHVQSCKSIGALHFDL